MPLYPSHDPLWWLPALRVYAGVLLMGYAAWPWWYRVWKNRPDRGAGMWPAGGIFVYVLMMQLFWRTGLLELRFVWALLLMVGIGISGRWLLPRLSQPDSSTEAGRVAARQALIVFSVLFWFWALVRSADPGVQHTEQPMDAMWMRTAMAASEPPVRDSWFGGAPATYYTDGHQALGFLAVKFGLDPAVAVNTGQILWFALTGLLAFQVGVSLSEPASQRQKTSAGILSVLLVCFVSTLHGAVDAFVVDRFWWWWGASRVLEEGGMALITEFPFFSFYLGDNHAHVLGVPILLLSMISAIELSRTEQLKFPALLPIGICIVWSWRINPWQTPTVIALLMLALAVRMRLPTRQEWISLAGVAAVVLFLWFPTAAPGPELSLSRNTAGSTNAAEFLAVFGLLLPGCVWSLQRPGRWVLPGLMLLAAGMWGVGELVYLEDVFRNRMNTVFKIYYQLWILLSVIAAVGWSAASDRKSHLRGWARASLAACLLPGLWYAGRLSVEALRSPSHSLNAWSAESPEHQHLLKVADALIQSDDMVVEAPGQSYQPRASQLGTWTAGHTLLGWTGHQQQWRPGQSLPDPLRLYRAASREEMTVLLREFDADWVLLGPQERQTASLHPQWTDWMDFQADRVVDLENLILYRIR